MTRPINSTIPAFWFLPFRITHVYTRVSCLAHASPSFSSLCGKATDKVKAVGLLTLVPPSPRPSFIRTGQSAYPGDLVRLHETATCTATTSATTSTTTTAAGTSFHRLFARDSPRGIRVRVVDGTHENVTETSSKARSLRPARRRARDLREFCKESR